MAIILFVKPSDLTEGTILGGNIDVDKILHEIDYTQVSVIEPLLGTELFDKMIADKTDPITYVGLYLELFNKFIFPITKFQSTANILDVLSYTVNNSGITKANPTNAEVVDKDEVQFLSQVHSSKAQNYILRFDKWIRLNSPNIPEYKRVQDEVDANNHLKVTGGWYFGSRNNGLKNDEGDLW